jgi:hypothetical protein
MNRTRPIHSHVVVEGDAKFTGLLGFLRGLCVLPIALIPFLPGPTLGQSALECTHLSPAITPSLDSNASESDPATDNASPDDFPAWKTVSLGTYKNVMAVRDALNRTPSRCPIYVGRGASEALGRLYYSEALSKLNLIVARLSGLGFGDDGASLKDIYERASRLGLALAPAELGPTLRLEYLDQPLGEFLHIAMKPVTRDGGDPIDFTIGNGGAGLLLLSGDAHSDSMAPSGARFVFVQSPNSGRIPSARLADWQRFGQAIKQ